MIKAKKGLLITLFAAVMMFAFGATSAFAAQADDVEWGSDFKTATVYYAGGQAVVDAEWAFGTNGVTTASIAGSITTIGGESITIPSKYQTKYFVDLTGAAIGYNFYGNHKLDKVYSLTAYQALGAYLNRIQVMRPEGATGPASAWVASPVGGWNYTIAIDSAVTAPNPAAPVTASFTAASAVNMDGSAADRAAKIGDSIVNTVQVVADPLLKNNWYEDVYHKTPSPSGSSWTETYDAAEHVAYVPETKGYAIQYQQYDAKAGAWVNVDKVSWKNATQTAVQYRAALTPVAVDEDTPIIAESNYPTLTIAKVNPYNKLPKVTWTAFNNWDKNSLGEYVITEELAKDPVAMLNFENDFAADLEEIKAYFNDTYIVDVNVSAADKTKQTWQIKDNWTNVSADIQAKYATLIDNYGGFGHDGLDADLTAKKVEVNDAAAVDTDYNEDIVDITFAPGMTYKVKKAKKLKKTMSFTLEATAKSGKAITWVLQTPNKKISIDAETGKVTVKKGLKKGTYKCKVTARTTKGMGYAAAQDVAELIIKIKK